MQQQLAARFNEISHQLTLRGDLIVMRKTRQLIAAGEIGEAVAFLRSAGQTDVELNGLADALTTFAQGGDLQALINEAAWRDGALIEDFTQAQIEEATKGDLNDLVESLVRQTQDRHVPLRPEVDLTGGAPIEAPAAPIPPTPSVAFPMDDEIADAVGAPASVELAPPPAAVAPAAQDDVDLEAGNGWIGPIVAFLLLLGTIAGLYFFLLE